MNDEQILERGGTEEDIRKYAEENGANLTLLDVLQAEARDRFTIIAFDNHGTHVVTQEGHPVSELDSLVANVYTAALQEALGKVPGEKEKPEWKEGIQELSYRALATGFNKCRTETIQGITNLFPKNEV